MHNPLKAPRGFTLLEILLVVAAIAILAGIVIVALNPGKQLGDTRDAERSSDVTTILNAIYQYSLDNDGDFPSEINSVTGDYQVIGNGGDCSADCTAQTTIADCADLSTDLVGASQTYLVDIPQDPSSGSAAHTDYYVNTTSGGRLVVGACDPEQATAIEVTR